MSIALTDGAATIVGELAAAPTPPVVSSGWELVATDDGTALYASGPDELLVIDAATHTVTARHPWLPEWTTSLGPLRLAHADAGQRLFLNGPRGILVAELGASLTEIGRLAASEIEPGFVLAGSAVVSTDLRRLYTLGGEPDDAHLVVVGFDSRTWLPAVDRLVPVPTIRGMLALSAPGDHLFASFENDDPARLRIFDTETLDARDLPWLAPGARCRALLASALERNVVYSTSGNDLTVTTIDGL